MFIFLLWYPLVETLEELEICFITPLEYRHVFVLKSFIVTTQDTSVQGFLLFHDMHTVFDYTSQMTR